MYLGVNQKVYFAVETQDQSILRARLFAKVRSERLAVQALTRLPSTKILMLREGEAPLRMPRREHRSLMPIYPPSPILTRASMFAQDPLI